MQFPIVCYFHSALVFSLASCCFLLAATLDLFWLLVPINCLLCLQYITAAAKLMFFSFFADEDIDGALFSSVTNDFLRSLGFKGAQMLAIMQLRDLLCGSDTAPSALPAAAANQVINLFQTLLLPLCF